MPADVKVAKVIRPVEDLREALYDVALPAGHQIDSRAMRVLDMTVDRIMWAAAEAVAHAIQDTLDARKAAA